MRAIVCTKYGPPDVLQLREVAKPVPNDHDVLVKVHATTAFMGDCELRGLRFPFAMRTLIRLGFGIRRPRKKILGQEFAGVVESVGKAVELFKEGDRIFGPTGLNFGAYAEYVCLPSANVMTIMPSNMTYEEAAAVPTGGLNALHFMRKGDIRNGQKVLIRGAGGTIGTFAIQLGKYYGAEVTGVDSADKLDMLRSIGADHVIDYTKEDITKIDEAYDVIFDVVGKSSYRDLMGSLKENGTLLLGNPNISQALRKGRVLKRDGKKVIVEMAEYRVEDLDFLRGLIEAGRLKSVIDRCFPLEQTVEAHRYVETGHKKGNVVITLMERVNGA
ncbi:MAG: NAD(P)-dependent alcohol dehydrogenase [Methanobacteriota archaeon]|nr:MAG: NAD(P)-dependent alcohol dehydrogenase [Euryarchaeota archaeon]